LKCTDCQFAFTKEIPCEISFFKNRYQNDWFDPRSEIISNRKTYILDYIFEKIEKIHNKKGKLLDVGSFAGKLLLYAKDNGYDPSGVEVNPKLAKFTKQELGFETYNQELQTLNLPEQEFNIITIIDVLEHLVSPRIVLEKLFYTLKINGILVIKVPNYPMQNLKQTIANWIGMNSRGIFGGFAHVNHFNVHSMKWILEELGFELIDYSPAPSEKWNNNSLTNVLKNVTRSIYFKGINALFNLTKINLAMNNCYIAKKVIKSCN